MDLWETALYKNDKVLAKRLTKYVDDSNLNWKDICELIEYPFINAWCDDNVMTSHFRRTLNELKLLSVYGKHCWRHFHTTETQNRIY